MVCWCTGIVDSDMICLHLMNFPVTFFKLPKNYGNLTVDVLLLSNYFLESRFSKKVTPKEHMVTAY